MEQKKEQRGKHPFDERQERVKQIYNTMQRSLKMQEKEKRRDTVTRISAWFLAAAAFAILVVLLLLWKFFF